MDSNWEDETQKPLKPRILMWGHAGIWSLIQVIVPKTVSTKSEAPRIFLLIDVQWPSITSPMDISINRSTLIWLERNFRPGDYTTCIGRICEDHFSQLPSF